RGPRRGLHPETHPEPAGVDSDDDRLHRPGGAGRPRDRLGRLHLDVRRRHGPFPHHAGDEPARPGPRPPLPGGRARMNDIAARRRRRRRMDAASHWLFLLAIVVALAVLAILLWDLLSTGLPRLSWSFLTSHASRFADRTGILAPLVGSFYVIVLTAAFALPVGVATAVFLEFYAEGDRPSPLRQSLTQFLKLNIDNLAGVPSIVYGLFGLAFFVRWM